MKKYILGSIAVFTLLSMPGLSSAGIPSGTKRLHLDTMFLGFMFVNTDPEDGPDIETSTFSIGLGKPQVGAGFGISIIDNLVLGARFTGYFETVHNDDADWRENTFYWGVLPYVEYIFLNQLVRPFIMGTTGFRGDVMRGEAGDADWEGSTWAFLIGGGGGVHFFVTRNFSIDLIGLFEYSIAKHREEYGDEEEATSNIFELSLLLGLSGWF